MDRSKKIIQTSIVGIVVNAFLVAFKLSVGLISNSISVILDAVNNLSDALSSVITIVGTKLSGKKPDKKHPYGYGRIEYLTSVVIAVLVLFAGVTSAKESVSGILHPSDSEFSVISLIIIAVAIIAKLAVGIYVKKVGKSVNSGSLVASGSDALFDAILSAGTLLSALLSFVWNINIEGWIGAIISAFIIKAGIEMLLEALHTIIGERADPELTRQLKEEIGAPEAVKGVYDLTLHNYGPDQIIATAHIELADSVTAKQIHLLTRQIATAVFMKFGIILTLGIYAGNDSSEIAVEIKSKVKEILKSYPAVLQMHGFYADEATRQVMFDLIVDFQADAEQIQKEVCEKLSTLYPDYRFDIILDSDYSDVE